eukprot:3624915-Pleurochrysis_carterae.AAC.2
MAWWRCSVCSRCTASCVRARLRADADRVPDGAHVREDGEPVDGGVAGRGRDEAGQHRDGRRLARAVRAEQRRDLRGAQKATRHARFDCGARRT